MNKNQSFDKFENLDNAFGFELTSSPESTIIESDDYQDAMDIIVPFLQALKKDPEKEYIKWPDRIQILDGLLDKLYKIREQ